MTETTQLRESRDMPPRLASFTREIRKVRLIRQAETGRSRGVLAA